MIRLTSIYVVFLLLFCIQGFSQVEKPINSKNRNEIGLRFAPSIFGSNTESGTDPVGAELADESIDFGIEFDITLTHVSTTGRILRARIGHSLSKAKGIERTDFITDVDYKQFRDNVFCAVGIGRHYSHKRFILRFGLEYVFAWQYRDQRQSFGFFLNNLGEQNQWTQSITNPREVHSSLQVFTSLNLEISKRISAGIEIRQPLTMEFIRGKQNSLNENFDNSGNLLSSEKAVQEIRETRMITPEVMLPVIGIRIKL